MFSRSLRVSKVVIPVVLFLALLLAAGLVSNTAGATVNAGNLSFDPSNPSEFVGNSVLVDVRLDSISNVYGAELGISFDPALLQVEDADGGVAGVQITPGACPAPNFVAQNEANNAAGTIGYAVTQLNPTPPCNGGVVATIEFLCVAEGISPITFDSSLIADPDGLSIAHTVQNGTVECVDVPPVIIQGAVNLQGWPSPSGVEVVLKDGGGAVVDSTVVGSSGDFLFNAEAGVTYSVETAYDRYLGTSVGGLSGAEGDTIDVGPTALPAGDLNGDGTINILDIVMVAGNFGKSTFVGW
ncbi:MAG: hypothetical protein JSW55_18200 [Chloroflexota bacterium]|nr:MAG: hypothetical protein JSW55_18200 [Chloroflexota bacterium]